MALPVRDLLAAVLGVVLGLVLVAFPQAVVRVHTVGRTPRTPGPYGGDAETDEKWLWLVRLLGVVGIGVGLYIGSGLV